MSVVVVAGYIHNIQRLIIEQNIPNELYSMVIDYYRCQHITMPDASDSYDSELDESTTTTTSDSDIPSSKQSNSNKQDNIQTKKPKWTKYWTENELHGRYMPIKRIHYDLLHGVMFKGKSTKNNSFNGLAIDTKVMFYKFRSYKDEYRFLRELRVLRCLNSHPSIIKLYDIVSPIDPSNFKHLTIILEDVGTNLHKIFRSKQYFSDFQIKYILYHILLGIHYMHRAGIAHRNLQPSNVLINADCNIKICDFGLALGFDEDIAVDKKQQKRNRTKKSIQRSLAIPVVTRYYRAPEMMLLQQKKEYLQAIDMWSIGCIFAELLQMQKENCPTVWKRDPLFLEVLFLSPKRSKKIHAIYQSHFDPIRVIFEVLGTATKEERAFLDDEQAQAFLDDLPKQTPQNLTEMFPNTDEYGINLLKSMLKFHPKARLNAMESLKCPYFHRVRNIKLENIQCPFKLDYNKKGLKEKQSHKLILEEVLHYQQDDEIKYKMMECIKRL